MSKNKQIAEQFVKLCNDYGWTVKHRDSESTVVTIEKRFTLGNLDEFVIADGEYYHIIGILPQTSNGSWWGTDGGGVGAISAHKNGHFVYNRSGISKRVIKQINKLLGYE